MMVFLDVGAHVGESLTPALDPRYGFDRIVCFEPVESCCAILETIADERVEICEFGLWNANTHRLLYHAGHLSGTVFGDANLGSQAEVVEFRRARDWFQANVSADDEVYLKLNCEGSECDILDELISSDEIRKVRSALVDFDVRKFPSLAHREREVRERLDRAGYSRILCPKERYRGPSHTATMENWLHAAGASSAPPSVKWRWRYRWFPTLVRTSVAFGKGIASRLLPRPTYERLRLTVQRRVYGYPPDADQNRKSS